MTRIAVVHREKCNPVKCGNHLCIRLCPINREGKDCILVGEDTKVVISEELCTGCGICPNRCPFNAIQIVNLPEALDGAPIHRYGENMFAMFNLPIPQFGKVVGILGRNGIGKSTAVKVLSGIIKPNFGELGKEVEYKEIIEHFRGSEAQGFFERMRDGGITVAYKPQHVDMIPRNSTGTVKELLLKVDERGALDEIAEKLGITGVLDRDISQISGGELQRVAIAATVLKKANVYIFDEPTSYLDIHQRIEVAKFIRGLADEETAVMVVEHDLVVLDYMTDLLHIMYGKVGVFGVVSQPKATRVGMNVYLSGYLKEENVRFRDSHIRFIAAPPVKRKKSEALVSWKGIRKKLGSFSLSATEGEVPRAEVTGVLGQNGIGKTTLARILAGDIEADGGEMSDNIKVSYKPQYLVPGDELVMNALHDAIRKFKAQIIGPLKLEPLFMRKLDELSGGELQRVAIARCLSQDAELFLLDEPSAYLDVEQRLLMSKVIRDFAETGEKSVIVVDHDLIFLDYLSDSLMVFDGEPSIWGEVSGPFSMEDGMNRFLDGLSITLRRDPESKRPRINKPDSQKDKEQRSSGKLYYS
ncbi:MAG: ribosome biogenesis/translation initiation ATPase RLI [archaeon]